MGTVPPLRRVEVEPVITGPLMTGPLITGPEESPELPELTEIIDGALVIFLCREAGDAGMVQVWRCWAERREREKRRRELSNCICIHTCTCGKESST